jgi:hypothetical protein
MRQVRAIPPNATNQTNRSISAFNNQLNAPNFIENMIKPLFIQRPQLSIKILILKP